MKIGKEEAMGMLAAVEMWIKRDHNAEWKQWMGWLAHIEKRVSGIAGVTTTVTQPGGLSNSTPSLRLWWDAQRFGFSGETSRARSRNRAEDRPRRRRRPGPPVETGVA